MGGRSARGGASTDPFYNDVPPLAAYSTGYDPGGGGLSVYDPYAGYEYRDVPTRTIGNLYGAPIVPRPTKYGGLYAQGLNQMPGTPPWNYGNYYLGNTTMQMMPFMMNKIGQYGQMPAMAGLGNGGLFGGAGMMSSMPCCMPQSYSCPATPCCMPQSYSMPTTPCCMPQPYSMSQSYRMPTVASMMAAATPLPVALNPLVQGMYPMATASPVNWMTPSSFMSALTTGPMPYRPPAVDFPSNVGMVMAIPYGTPNPLLSSSAYSSATPAPSYGAQSPSCCSYYYSVSTPASSPSPPAASAPTPAATYYPHPGSVSEPYLASYSAPAAVASVQQVPVMHSVSTVAPPVVASPYDQPSPQPYADTLLSSQSAYPNGAIGQPVVLGTCYDSSRQAFTYNESTKGTLPVYNAADRSNSLIGQPILSPLSTSTSNTGNTSNITVSKAKYIDQPDPTKESSSSRLRRFIPSIPRLSFSSYHRSVFERRSEPILPPILHGQLISDSGWLSKHDEPQAVTSILTKKKKKRPYYASENIKSLTHKNDIRVSFIPHRRRRRHRSNSSASEYDCAICHQQREKRRLQDYYGSSTLSSLFSTVKEPFDRRISSNESVTSSALYSPPTLQKENYKNHSRYAVINKAKSKPFSSDRSGSPLLLRQTTLPDSRKNLTIHEVDEEEEEARKDEAEQEEAQKDEVEQEQPSEKKMSDGNDSTLEKADHTYHW